MSKCKQCVHNKEPFCDYINCTYAKKIDYFKPKKWEPLYHIESSIKHIDMDQINDRDDEYHLQINTATDTQKQAEDLDKKLVQLTTLHAWASEHGYIKEWIYSQNNWFIEYDANNSTWGINSINLYNIPYIVYMTKEGAKATAEALNNEILIL